MATHLIDPREVRDIAPDVLDPAHPWRPQVLPASFWAGTTPAERALFGNRHALYGFPTVELVAWLREFIGDRMAIEIGSGNGGLADAVGIHATDNCHQTDHPESAAYYLLSGQRPVTYGPNVEKLDGNAAVAKYRPQVVVAQWVTHRYDSARHAAGGNMYGVDEERIIRACEHYVLIGNEEVHKNKSIWRLKHEIIYPEWVYSRALNGSRDFIAIWQGGRLLSDRALKERAALARA